MSVAAMVLTQGLGILLLNALAWGVVTWIAPNFHHEADPDRDLDPYETAYIEGGPDRVVDVALRQMTEVGHARADSDELVEFPPPTTALDPVQASLRAAAGAPDGRGRTAPVTLLRRRMAEQASVRRVRERLAADGLATGPGYPARKVTRIMAGPVCVIGAVTSPIPLLAFPTPLAVAVVSAEVVGGGLLFWAAGRGRLTRHGRARRRILRERSRAATTVMSPHRAGSPRSAAASRS